MESKSPAGDAAAVPRPDTKGGIRPDMTQRMPSAPKATDVPSGMNPMFLAYSRLKRRRIDDCIALTSEMLAKDPYDQNYISDLDMEEEGVADIIMDENAMAAAPRPGTSLKKPLTAAQGGQPGQGIRPMSSTGRPLTGFARPGTQSRGQTGKIQDAFQGPRPGTSRPVSQAGRFVRLGTASMLSDGEQFINVDKLDFKKYVRRPALAKALCDFIIYHDHNPKKALELAAEATQAEEFKDWWWKARLGKCYYQLGMYRDAEKQFKSALKMQEMIETYLELSKVYLRLDQPNTALDNYMKASEKYPGDTSLILGVARVYDALNDLAKGVQYYKKVLHYDSSNVEAIACLASQHFYTDQPELALRYYRRLLQMGVNNAELWSNLGLCCFYTSQYDITLSCFDRALALASDDNMADVWYNIGQLAIGIGDLNLAYQAFKIAISIDPNHAESYNNLGILELRKGNTEEARSHFQSAGQLAEHMFEPFFNSALLAFKMGDCQTSFQQASRALGAFPDHADSHELLAQLKKHFTQLG